MIKKKAVTHKTNLDAIRKSFQQSGGSDGDKWLKIPEPEKGQDTTMRIRVLPPANEKAEGFFYYTAGLHYGFTIGGRNRALGCPESVGKGKCPVCKFIGRLKNSSEDYSKLIQSIRLNRRYWLNVIDRADPDTIRIYGTNKKFVETVLDAMEDSDIGDITDPKTGYDIILKRRGKGFNTRYSYRVASKSTPVVFKSKDMYDLTTEVIEWAPYNDMIKYLMDNYSEEIREVGLKFKGVVIDDDTEEEEEETVSRKSKKVAVKKKAIAKKSKPVVEDEDDEEDEIEAEDFEFNEDEEEDEE